MTARPSDLLPAYREHGFATVGALFSAPDVEAMRAECVRLWSGIDASTDRDDVHWRDHAVLGRIVDRLDPVRTRSEMFAAMALRPDVVAIVEAILGGPAFILKDKLIMKRPGTVGYGAHQDYSYWDGIGLRPDDICTAMIALDDTPRERGPLELYAGLHRDRLPGAPDDPLDVAPEALVGRTPFLATMMAGDALFFHSLVPHGSAPNHGQHDRRAYFVTYARRIAEPEEIHSRYRAAMRTTHAVHRKTASAAR